MTIKVQGGNCVVAARYVAQGSRSFPQNNTAMVKLPATLRQRETLPLLSRVARSSRSSSRVTAVPILFTWNFRLIIFILQQSPRSAKFYSDMPIESDSTQFQQCLIYDSYFDETVEGIPRCISMNHNELFAKYLYHDSWNKKQEKMHS